MEDAKVVEFIRDAAIVLRKMSTGTIGLLEPSTNVTLAAHDLCIKADRLMVALANAKPEPMASQVDVAGAGLWTGAAPGTSDKAFCWVYDRITGTSPEQLLEDIVGPQGQGWEPVGGPTYDQRGGWFFVIRRPRN